MYTVTREKNLWHVLKDGRHFTTTESEQTAIRMAESLNQAKTPAMARYASSDVDAKQPKPKRDE